MADSEALANLKAERRRVNEILLRIAFPKGSAYSPDDTQVFKDKRTRQEVSKQDTNAAALFVQLDQLDSQITEQTNRDKNAPQLAQQQGQGQQPGQPPATGAPGTFGQGNVQPGSSTRSQDEFAAGTAVIRINKPPSGVAPIFGQQPSGQAPYGIAAPGAPRQAAPYQPASQQDTAFGAYVNGLSDQEFRAFQERLYASGLYVGVKDPALIQWGNRSDLHTLEAFQKLNAVAANFNQIGRIPDMDSLLDQIRDDPSLIKGGREDAVMPQRTVTETNVNARLTNAGDAFNTMMGQMRTLLGRWPTSAEVAAFTRALNAQERANPVVSTATTTRDFTPVRDADGVISRWDQTGSNTSTTQSGGVNAESASIANILKNFGPEGASYGIMQYSQALEQALSGHLELG